jgi:hypothetical protein
MNWALYFILGSCLAMAFLSLWLKTRPENDSEGKLDSQSKSDL